MKSLKAIKRLLKQNKQWSEYKKKYAHKQMRLVSSKIALIYNQDLSLEELYKLEVMALEAKKVNEEKMFEDLYFELDKMVNRPYIDWESFGRYMWYTYQTSTYWKDVKKKRPNVFNSRNYIEQNAIKREYYSKWLQSIDLSIEGANDRIIKVQKEVF